MVTDSQQLQLPQCPAYPPATSAAASECGARATYTLRYEDDALGIEKRVEFEAQSAAYALEIARAEVDGRQALLLENGRPLCRLMKALPGEAPYWIIADRPGLVVPPAISSTAAVGQGAGLHIGDARPGSDMPLQPGNGRM